MKKTNVIGIGAISALGNSVQEIWERLNTEQEPFTGSGKLLYESCLPASKRRRLNRYSDMALFSASNARSEASAICEQVSAERIGTIYTTGFGPMTSNLDFANQVLNGDPDLCSPTVFSSTVSNTCLGHICMNLNCKGVSTILMGANSLGYSQMLLSKNDADLILSGAVEEYSEELYDCFSRSERAKGIHFSESAVTFLLAGEAIPIEDAYCTLVDFGECDLGGCPVFNRLDEKQALLNMKSMLEQMIHEREIDLVITSENGISFDSLEQEALHTLLPQVPRIGNVKALFGETLGASFHMNALAASLILKYNQIPKALKLNGSHISDVKRILVTGFSVAGNYFAYIFDKYKQ